MKTFTKLGLTLSFSLFLSCTFAQSMLERYEKAESFLPKNIGKLVKNSWLSPNWIGDSSTFWYTEQTDTGKQYRIFNSKGHKSQTAFDHEKMAKIVSEKTNKTVSPDSLSLRQLKFADDLSSLSFKLDEETITVDLKSYKTSSETEEQVERKKNESTSPDGKWVVSLKEYNLYLRNTETGEEKALTTDGVKDIDYANPDASWAKPFNIEEGKPYDPWINIYWSKDSKKFVTYKLDHSKVNLMYLYQSTPDSGYRTKVYAYERAIPGEACAEHEYFVFDVEKATQTKLDVPKIPTSWSAFGPYWQDGSNEIVLGGYKRGYQLIELFRINAADGSSKKIMEERAETMLETQLTDLQWINDDKEYLFTSERDGWNHIYRYSANGELLNQVTSGDFVVRNIKAIDEKSKTIYFIAGGYDAKLDPYYQQLFKVGFDGKGLTCLTPENADHNIEIAPDYKSFTDTYSRVDLPPVSEVRSVKSGKAIAQVFKADVSELLATGWKYPQPFKTKARDGKTDIYGVVFYPSDFDSTKVYPVIDGTYSGPQAVRAPKQFNHAYRSFDVSFAELGFIVVTVDGLGSALRSKAFHDFSYKNLGDIGSLDHIKAIKSLAQNHHYIDTTRVGIYGHSAGGYDACRAMLIHPEFYKVGIASAGNHDHRIAKAWWPEQYMGLVGPHYDEQSNFKLADKLEGKLLLVHGDMDNNVNTASSLRMAGEFIKHNKDVDLMIVPNKDHGTVFQVPYFLRKRWDYFVENLAGETPPHNYEIKSYE